MLAAIYGNSNKRKITITNSFMTTSRPNNIDEYIARFPLDIQKILEQIRETIRKVVPEAEETISYGIPTFNLNGTYLIYFAAHKNHIGLYPVPAAIEQVDKDFASYKTSGKGTVQFPLNKPIPLNLIAKLVKFKVKESVENVKKQKQEKKSAKP
jgi:uncharacterized protein YdhG (YjbR/CyaY superfamily)